jgi:phage-related protein
MAEETVLIRFKSDDEVTKTTKAVNDGLDDVGKNATKAGSSFSGMGSIMNGVLQGVGQALGGFALKLGGQALSAVTDFISGSIQEASQWDSAIAQTEAVIKSTGGAAGLTAQQMGDMAAAMSASAGASIFSDDAILGAQNVLATFTNIKGVNFGTATQSILDMSQALGMDLNSASMQVGKALNDPIKGLAALSRSGVTFSKEQEATIKAMVETGNVAGAQKLMLDELSKEFGGSAAAAVNTYAGQQVVLQEKMAGIQQTLGEALMPILMEFGSFLADTVVPVIADVIGGLSTWLSDMQALGVTGDIFFGIRDAIAAVPEILAQMSAGLAVVTTFLQPLTDAVMNFAAVFVPAITSAGTAIMEYLATPQVTAYIQLLSELFVQLATTLQDVLVLAFQALTVEWQHLVEAFTVAWPYIQTVFDTFLSLATIVINFVIGLLQTISKLVKGDFAGAWETLKTTVGTALESIWTFAKDLYKNISGFVGELVGKFKEIGTQISAGIASGITSAASSIKNAALDAAKSAYQSVKDFFGIQSPSKLMHDMIGINVSKGIATGITAGIPQITGAAELAAASGATTVNNYSFNASYANTQSESSLINDARAMMISLGAI